MNVANEINKLENNVYIDMGSALHSKIYKGFSRQLIAKLK